MAELYERHVEPLFRHALVLTRDRSDAEDLVQTVFVKLATTGAELLGVRDPSSYLHRILHTAWLDGVRRGAAGERAATRNQESAPEWMRGHHGAADATIDTARALDSLPRAQRQAVLLHAIEGFSFREIGRMTGVSLFTAAARYRTGINRLRTALDAPTGDRR